MHVCLWISFNGSCVREWTYDKRASYRDRVLRERLMDMRRMEVWKSIVK
jgi:hypothetical protein